MGSVSSRPERNGHRTSTSRWDIARLGARDSVSGAAEGDRHRACDGGGRRWGDFARPGSSSVAAPRWSLEPGRGSCPSPGCTCPRGDPGHPACEGCMQVGVPLSPLLAGPPLTCPRPLTWCLIFQV